MSTSRRFACFAWLILWAPLYQAGAEQPEAPHLTRQQLIGAWRLVRIEYSGPSGPLEDPFYQPGSTGIILYDSSGWMSVHIVAPGRPAWEVPASRTSSPAGARDAELKAAAFDTYYTYFGTWDLDEAASVVTHHVVSALIPAETGLRYTQKVTLEGGHLVFTNRSGKGEEIVRRKIWERAGDR
jgi:Lipocalin-like domain